MKGKPFGGRNINGTGTYRVDPHLIKLLGTVLCDFTRSEKQSTEHFITIGKIALQIKSLSKHGEFRLLITSNYPHFSLRTIQRAMRLVEYYDFDTYSSLLLVPRTQLELIAKTYSWDEAIDILKDNLVHLEFDENDDKALKKFLLDMRHLAKGTMGYMSVIDVPPSSPKKKHANDLWEDIEYPLDVVEPDEAIPNTANSREVIPNKFIEFIKALRQTQNDVEKSLELKEARKLLTITTGLLRTVEEYNPSKLERKDLEKTITALKKLIKKIKI